MAYRARVSLYERDGSIINQQEWSAPIQGSIANLIRRLRGREGKEVNETETGWAVIESRSLMVKSTNRAEVVQVTEFEPTDELALRPAEMWEADRDYVEPISGFLSDAVQARRKCFYDLADKIFPLDDQFIRERQATVQAWADRLSTERVIGAIAPGRDGQGKAKMIGRVQVNENPKQPEEWVMFQAEHPIDVMRIKGTLGKSQPETVRRYQAAIVWHKFLVRAEGGESSGDWLSEKVDSSPDPEQGVIKKAEAASQRAAIRLAPGVTSTRFNDLDSVVGRGMSLRERARATNRQHTSVRKSLLSGLDAVAKFDKWQNHLEGIQVLYVEPISDKHAKRYKKSA